MQKKLLIPIVIVLLIVGGVGAYFLTRGNSSETTDTSKQKKKVEEPVNVIPVAERPYVQIAPVADGRNVELLIKTLSKPATSVEYELEYQSGSLLQGAFGLIQLASVPAKETILLGSCSAGGKCSYHEDVKGGSLKLSFDGTERYAVKSDWRYFENKAKETAFASKDAKFQIESPAFATQPHVVIYNSPGRPEGAENVVSEQYSLAVSKSISGKADLTIRAEQEGTLQILGWDGTEWQAFDSTVDGKMVTAEVDILELYLVVLK